MFFIIIIITSSDDIQPSTLLSNQSPSGLILQKSQALGNTLYDVCTAEATCFYKFTGIEIINVYTSNNNQATGTRQRV